MNIQFLRNLFVFILFFLGQPSFAQSINDQDLQKLLIENPSLMKQLQQENPLIEEKLVSENQRVTNTENDLQLGLSQAINHKQVNKKSMLSRYFYALIGEDLNIYGSNEFNRPQDDSLLFFNTIGKNYKLAPGDKFRLQ